MHIRSFRNFRLWYEGFTLTVFTTGIIGSVMTILGVSLLDFFPNTDWFDRLFCILSLFVISIIIITIIKSIIIKYGVSLKIHGITVFIKQGDLFKAKGNKIIPFNEYFDTIVDGRIVSKETLHGIFITNYIKDKALLKQAIENIVDDNTPLKRFVKNNRMAYPLGRIVTFEDYFLLSFSEFNEYNEAHLTKLKYENCLMNMWEEICRLYQHNPIYLPLVGSGITRIDDWLTRSNFDLLVCMLKTLYLSKVDIRRPVTIILTKEVIDSINIYELKGVKYL